MSLEQAVVQLEQTNAALQEEVVRFRDSAMGLNAIYSTITEGRQAVADGKYFSVPGNGAYMRLYRRQGSSAELIAEFPDRDELNSVIDQLGPLLGRGVVGGSGDLMAQGAFGLGNSTNIDVPDDNLDTCTVSGVYRATMSVVGRPGGRGLYQVQHWQQGAGVAAQIAFETGNITYPKALMRARGTSGNWTAWFSIFNSHNILGTVSQSGGVPTGAIIERGSNANGEYVKFADGTLICTRTASGDSLGVVNFTSSGSGVFNSGAFSFDYPISFFGSPHATYISGLRSNIWASNDVGWSNIRLIAGTDFTGTFESSRKLYLFAIGRWY